MTRRHRVILCVETADGLAATMRIPSWHPDRIVPMVLDVIPEELRPLVTEGGYFLAMVNLDATTASELNPTDFEYVPPLRDDDELT